MFEILTTTTTTTTHIEQNRTSIPTTETDRTICVRVRVCQTTDIVTRQALDNCNNMAVISRRAIRFRGSEGTCHVLTIKRMFIIHNTNYLVHTFPQQINTTPLVHDNRIQYIVSSEISKRATFT